MDRYERLEYLGEGSFGVVYKAIDNETGKLVAVKCMKSGFNYSEVHALTQLQHSTVVKLEAVHHREHDDAVFLVFEYMEGSLEQHIKTRLNMRIPFSEVDIRSLCSQVLRGLAFMHEEAGFMHRDMKPGNLLVKGGLVKIADLGAATEIDSGTPHCDLVTTLWYSAPEMLIGTFMEDNNLGSCFYDEKVDMWAVGLIMAELFLMRPLFRGLNSEDQLFEICDVLGSPTGATWEEGSFLASFWQLKGIGLRAVIPDASDAALDLMESLCSWDPMKRPSAFEALQHPFFKNVQNDVGVPPGFARCNLKINKVVSKMTMHHQQPIY